VIHIVIHSATHRFVLDHMPTIAQHALSTLIATSTVDAYAMTTGADQTATSIKVTATAHATPVSAHRPPTVPIVWVMV